MFWFNPKRVGGGSPTAPLMQRTTVGPGPGPKGASGGAPPPPTEIRPLEFKVRYSLAEYIVFMWQHSGYLIRRRRVTGIAALWMTARSTWGAAFHFFVQRRSRHLYDFTIDEHGIVRANGTGVTLVPWADVGAIRRYSRGYMMVLKRGTLPIPFRCLNAEQTRAMDHFGAVLREAHRASHRQPAPN